LKPADGVGLHLICLGVRLNTIAVQAFPDGHALPLRGARK
jgi:hypothetical protein